MPQQTKRVLESGVRLSGAGWNPGECGNYSQQALRSGFHYLGGINNTQFHDFSLGGLWIPASAGMTEVDE